MIEAISIKKVASYGDEPRDFSPLKEVNFLYGPNGTGKTTISKLIDDPGRDDFGDCRVVWKDGVRLDTLVYNRDFIEKNFDTPNKMDGIFTLGEEGTKAQKEIDDKQEKLSEIRVLINRNKETLASKEAELEKCRKKFRNSCWSTVMPRKRTKFRKAFEPSMGGMDNFRDRVLREHTASHPVPTKSQGESLKELDSRSDSLFRGTITRIELIPLPDTTNLLSHETNTILGTIVVGRSDVDIADLIAKLRNSDWVKRGRVFYTHELNPDRLCPFCQQTTPTSLARISHQID